MKALSIRQPWATLIVTGHKKIENRTWSTNHRGLILIHASKAFDYEGWEWIRRNEVLNITESDNLLSAPRGGIVGIAKLVNVLKPDKGEPNMFRDMNQYSWVLEDAKPLRFQPYKGKLGLFEYALEITP